MSAWHVDDETIDAYRANALSDAAAASLEAHLVVCDACRASLTARVDDGRLARNLTAVLDVIDAPSPNPVERLLARVGVPPHTARLVSVTPAMRLGWIAGLVVVSGLAMLASTGRAEIGGVGTGAFWFLVLTPIVPVLGVAASFGRRADPAHELALAAPVSALELLLIRAAAVLATSTPVSALASMVLPGSDWTAGAWLLPALGLTAATLALARWAPLRVVAVGLSAAWFAAAAVATRHVAAAELVHDFPAFRPAGQVAFLTLGLLAVASIVITRNSFDLRRAT
ncbi:MAG: hypothetical protein Q8K63_14440 [Acidimicrobiales bacterium]|nr:hypothetical protein [Acidimicrobiales bacterium]